MTIKKFLQEHKNDKITILHENGKRATKKDLNEKITRIDTKHDFCGGVAIPNTKRITIFIK